MERTYQVRLDDDQWRLRLYEGEKVVGLAANYRNRYPLDEMGEAWKQGGKAAVEAAHWGQVTWL